nr:MAG TPA: hypothetical protein [Caudoviricetes sp.]
MFRTHLKITFLVLSTVITSNPSNINGFDCFLCQKLPLPL